MQPSQQPAPAGIRFARLGGAGEPKHLIDAWLIADEKAYGSYFNVNDARKDFNEFSDRIDAAIGKSAKFVFIGSLDTHSDSNENLRTPAGVLTELGIDLQKTVPLAQHYRLSTCLYDVGRWPGYYLLITLRNSEVSVLVFKLSM